MLRPYLHRTIYQKTLFVEDFNAIFICVLGIVVYDYLDDRNLVHMLFLVYCQILQMMVLVLADSLVIHCQIRAMKFVGITIGFSSRFSFLPSVFLLGALT
ncbi:unnamed protein product [Calypogeia fissa]